MLDTLRANSRSVLTYVLFGIIIVVFIVSFGPGSRGCTSGGRSATWAAKVNGEVVSPGEFESQYGNLLRMYQSQGAGDLNPFFRAQLRQMALDQLVQRELVEQEAQRQGIVVTDDEISRVVKQSPAFQQNGQFDYELYKRAVTSNFGGPSKYEDEVRRSLAYQKMMALLRETAKVSDDDVKDAWLTENDKVSLEFARFPKQLARAEVHANDAQVKDFAAKNGDRVEQYYKANQAKYDKKKRVRARHILAKVEPNAPAEQAEAAKKKIEDAAARVKKGEDFAKLAKELSDDAGSKDTGGELGLFGEHVMAKPFEDAAFKMKKGELSEPVRTQFGWHLIQVEDVVEPEKISLEKATPDIARDLVEGDLAQKLAHDKAEETLKRLQSGKSFADVLPAEAKKKGQESVKLGSSVIKPDETGLFGAGDSPNIPRVGPVPELFADALKGNAGQVLARVYDTPAGPVVARVKERQRPDDSKFAEKKGEVEMRLRLNRESQIEQGWVKALKEKSKVELNGALVRGEVTSAPVDLEN
jgi:peptidyl-prolyl cis-trans isomerase D